MNGEFELIATGFACKHFLSDCRSPDLAELRIKHCQLFRSLYSGSSRLRDFMGQSETKVRALCVHRRLICCTLGLGTPLCFLWHNLLVSSGCRPDLLHLSYPHSAGATM